MGQEEFTHWLAYLKLSGDYGGNSSGGGGTQTPTINKFKGKLGKLGMNRRR